MKKRRLYILMVALILAICTIVFIVSPRDFKKIYKVDEYELIEEYDSELGYYAFSFKLDDIDFIVPLNSKYVGKKLVKSLKTYRVDSTVCVLLEGKKISSYPVCYDGNELVDYWQLDELNDDFYKKTSFKKDSFSYENVNVEKTLGNSYLIWNYKGYYYLKDGTKKKIEFLSKESYYNNLSYQAGRYVITPNYDQEYEFDEFLVIDMENGKDTTWSLKDKISYNSYFLGEHDGIIYMVDRKARKEYAIDPRKKKIERIDKDGVGKVWNSGFEDISMVKLIGDDYSFKKDSAIDFEANDGILNATLGGKDEMCISKQKISKIVFKRDDEVFYLVGDELYSYSLKYGEAAILKYSELNFNNVNSIFIY